MRIDLYTKVILTVIAIGVGMLVFQQQPITEAQAVFGGGDGMIATPLEGVGPAWVGHLRNGQVRFCRSVGGITICTEWSD
jgi:hypothetical protein